MNCDVPVNPRRESATLPGVRTALYSLLAVATALAAGGNIFLDWAYTTCGSESGTMSDHWDERRVVPNWRQLEPSHGMAEASGRVPSGDPAV